MHAPLIAVTTSEVRTMSAAAGTPQADPNRREMVLGLTYLEEVQRAGGLPVVLPPMPGTTVAPLLDRIDGLCLSGGPDIHPRAYRALPDPHLGPTEPQLDAWEIGLARAAAARGCPILAICRGAQVMNVVRGGTLHQHLPDVAEIPHRSPDRARPAGHPIEIAPDSLLASIVGGTSLVVNSFHHQAVAELGLGLVPTAWAPDGTIEAFEDPSTPFLIGVQWHVELGTDDPAQAALFGAFVRAAQGRGPHTDRGATAPVGSTT